MKTPLILLHGALGSKAQFNELQTICAKEYAVYSFDFSGHGKSESMAHFSIDLFVDDLFDFMQVNHIEKANIFGHSMGGYVALKAALQAPESFGKIITLGTKFNWNVENAFAEVSMLNPDTIESKVPAFTKALEQRHSGTNWRVNLWRTSLMMLQLGNQPALSFEDLAKIAQNTLICLGDSDKMVSRKESENAAAALPNGQFLLLENTDHPIEKVDFIKLAGVIQSFLNQ
jgi:pimeloyl-ACP methyl ester carboxylesterase